MSDILKKKDREIKTLLAERFQLREEVAKLKPAGEKLQEAEKIISIQKDKVKTLMQDISDAVEARSAARTEAAELKKQIEELQGVQAALESARNANSMLEQQINRLSTKVKELENAPYKVLKEDLLKTRRRLHERGNKIEEQRIQLLKLGAEKDELQRKVNYFESNEKLNAKAG